LAAKENSSSAPGDEVAGTVSWQWRAWYAAGVGRGRGGRRRGRDEGSYWRDEQQESGGQALHGFWAANQNPKWGQQKTES
jgi:hypothetical protein